MLADSILVERHGVKTGWKFGAANVSVKFTFYLLLQPISQSGMKHHTLSNYAPT
jgi:hypothetical protein